jgi:hypothetical protein
LTGLLDGRDVVQVQHDRGVRPNAPQEIGILNQRYPVRRDDLLQPRQPTGNGQFVRETLLQNADGDEGRRRCSRRSTQKGNERTVCRSDEFSSELQQSTTFHVWLDDLNPLTRNLQRPVIGLRVGEVFVQWRVEVENTRSGDKRSVTTKFVFIGAGGGALPLLQKSGIPEGKGYGGFPVSGIWLRCDDPDINKRHHAKVYGKAAVGSPPTSVPHLDTRVIGGQHSLLFGPYAGFSSKFLKHGSLLDLFESVRPANIKPLLSIARDNFDLTEYLIGQVLQSESHRLAVLPSARWGV